MKIRTYRWSKRLLLAIAALPMLQVAGCDPMAQLANAMFSVFVGSINQVLLTNFPSMDILQILLGANRHPFLNG